MKKIKSYYLDEDLVKHVQAILKNTVPYKSLSSLIEDFLVIFIQKKNSKDSEE